LLHHGGHFIQNGSLIYSDGLTSTWVCDPDWWSFFEIIGKLKEMGYHLVKELWYKVGKGSMLENKLKLLSDDKGALHMVNIARRDGNVHLFVVHTVSEAEVVDNFLEYYPLGDDNNETGNGNVEVQGQMDCDSVCIGGNNEQPHAGDNVVDPELQDDGNNEQPYAGDNVVDPELQDDGNNEQVDAWDNVVDPELQDDGNNEQVDKGDNVVDPQLQDDGKNQTCEDGREDDVQGEEEGHDNQKCDEGVEDVEVRSWTDSEADIADATRDQDFEDLVDVNIAYDRNGTDDHNLCEGSVEVDVYLSEGSHETGKVKINDRGLSENEWVLDHLDNGEESEESVEKEDNTKSRFMTFRMPINMEDYQWEIGTYFIDKAQFVDTIRTYGVHSGLKLKIQRNDNRRLRVICLGAKGKCKWFAYSGYVPAKNIWQLRKVVDKHTCSREFNVNVINAKWLSGQLKNTMRDNPSTRAVDIRKKISRKWNVNVTKSMSRRARALANDEVEGSFNEQFKRIYDYAHEILRSNLGSTAKVKVDTIEGKTYFMRFYMCLKACKDSFFFVDLLLVWMGVFSKGDMEVNC